MRVLRRVFPLLAVVFIAHPVCAQDWRGSGRLEGKVVDDQGKPVADATLKLDNPARGGGPTLKTNKKGVWAVLGLVAGRWNIDVEATGFAPRKLFANLASESERLPPMEIKLERAAAAPAGVPKEVMEAVQKGDTAYGAGRYSEARAEYEKLLALRPDLAATLHTQIARCYNQEGNYEKELEHLQAVLDAEPDNANLRSLMAQEALKGGMLERGLALLKGVDDSTITDPNVFFNIAVLLLNQQKAEEAIPYLTKAVGIDPTYVDGYFQRGLAYLQLQKLAESRADFRKVLELKPEGPQAETARKALEQLKD